MKGMRPERWWPQKYEIGKRGSLDEECFFPKDEDLLNCYLFPNMLYHLKMNSLIKLKAKGGLVENCLGKWVPF